MHIVEVSHLTKEYRLGAIQGFKQTLLNAAARLSGNKVQERSLFKALNDVSFHVEQGEVVGIIGHNGAGKSTLLKMLAKISTPTHGSVNVHGRIAPLIEVGAGFVADFTGRENVYLNGSILGMSRQAIARKFDEIVDFSEIAEFIDTPVKRYSSGMLVKLAFAVATSIEAEILIVDEVLAVGDLAFQRKCFDRMEDLIKRQGRSVVLVSHNIRQIQRLCNRVVMLDHGQITLQGDPQTVCDGFYAQSDEKIRTTAFNAQTRCTSSGEVELLEMNILDHDSVVSDRLSYNRDCMAHFKLRILNDLEEVTFGFGFHTTDFLYLTTHNSEEQLEVRHLPQGEYDINCKIARLPLLPGIYSMRFGITAGRAARTLFYGENLKHFQVIGDVPITVREGFFALDANWTAKTSSAARISSISDSKESER